MVGFGGGEERWVRFRGALKMNRKRFIYLSPKRVQKPDQWS